jgi:hypothetical protein
MSETVTETGTGATDPPDPTGQPPDPVPAPVSTTTPPAAPDPATQTPPSSATGATPGEQALAAERNALKKALDAERKQHRDVAARLSALEAQSLSDGDRAWQDKVDLVKAESDMRLKKVAARNALAQAGLQGNPTRLVGLLNLGDVTVDDDGELTGIEDQILELKTTYPGLFVVPAAAVPADANGNGADGTTTPAPGRVNIGSRKPAPVAPKGFAETLARQIAGPT